MEPGVIINIVNVIFAALAFLANSVLTILITIQTYKNNKEQTALQKKINIMQNEL